MHASRALLRKRGRERPWRECMESAADTSSSSMAKLQCCRADVELVTGMAGRCAARSRQVEGGCNLPFLRQMCPVACKQCRLCSAIEPARQRLNEEWERVERRQTFEKRVQATFEASRRAPRHERFRHIADDIPLHRVVPYSGSCTPGCPYRVGGFGMCGFRTGRECPVPFNISELRTAAAIPARRSDMEAREATAERECTPISTQYTGNQQQLEWSLSVRGNATRGGWCLVSRTARKKTALPLGHHAADLRFVERFRALVPFGSSILDLGAGVGQFGRALLRQDARYEYRGYDGAPNVRDYTDGFVRFVDLTMPAALPQSDWVVSMEVGEHLDRAHEMAYFRNLHVHNRKGVVISWAGLDQGGHGHRNPHDPQYVAGIFESLSYRLNRTATRLLRGERHKQSQRGSRSTLVLERTTPAAAATIVL